MKIFITGSTGFIGGHLIKKFAKHNIAVMDRKLPLLKQLKSFRPKMIINCAAEIYNPEMMVETNVYLVENCIDYILENPKCSLIQLGSSSEYKEIDRPTHELDEIGGWSKYAATKSQASLTCKSYATEWDLDIVVVRPYSPYGPGEKPHRLFPSLWKAFMKNQPMTLTQGVHDFCYIDDFVNAIEIIAHSKKRSPGEFINVSSGVQSSNLEVLEIFEKVTGKKAPVTIDEKWTTPKVWNCDPTHVFSKYNWSPKFSLEDGIVKFLKEANYE